ncbi:hypothetical protein ABPG72_006162 [Tetrahymena utriculariae]
MNKIDKEEESLRDDLKKLFQLLKSEKPSGGGNNDEIEKSTLMALMLYLDLQKNEPEFFDYVKDKLNSNTPINEKTFIDILLKPEISFQNLQTEKMASYFKIFDTEKKGSFSYEDFMKLYKESPEYKNMEPSQRSDVEKQILESFEIMKKDNRQEITPIEFYNIINFNQ